MSKQDIEKAKKDMRYDPIKGWYLPEPEGQAQRHPLEGGTNVYFKGVVGEQRRGVFYDRLPSEMFRRENGG